ncbi:hypothetical protein ACIRL3_25275 [Streptomyces sp. NPDC102384]|uniref:hypothetical protein n=1 Tax=Streptomyces sp. NPDC102384 TaxID=3366166 RepID=UPI003804EC6B
MSGPTDERDRIRAAMDRILAGRPQRSNGALTVVALAAEAQVPRNALTQRHPDLKNEFYARVTERGQPTDAETRLRKRVVKLKELRQKDQAELEQLRADVEGLVRTVNQLTLENQQLREQSSSSAAIVRALPLAPSPCRPGPAHLAAAQQPAVAPGVLPEARR